MREHRGRIVHQTLSTFSSVESSELGSGKKFQGKTNHTKRNRERCQTAVSKYCRTGKQE